MKPTFYPLLALILLAVGGCRRQAEQPAQPMEVEVAFTDTVSLPVQPASKRAKSRPTTPKKALSPSQKPRPSASAETLYVETDGVQGRVWGHVTMQGDTGSGTIHDWDENTLAVDVVRHGNELIATDQNSRQYIFRLK